MSHETHPLAAEPRDTQGSRPSRGLRREGRAPAVLYGYGVEPTSLVVDARTFEATYRETGNTALVDLAFGQGAPVRVFIQEVQRHPITRALIHVDFHAVNLREEIETEVPVVLMGEAPAVHNSVGVLLRGLETVTVAALPADLPQHIEISIEELNEVDDGVTVADLPASGAYRVTSDPEEMLVKIIAQQLEPEDEEAPEAAGETEDGAEPAEGDAADSEGA